MLVLNIDLALYFKARDLLGVGRIVSWVLLAEFGLQILDGVDVVRVGLFELLVLQVHLSLLILQSIDGLL